jgi:hypothetical protein
VREPGERIAEMGIIHEMTPRRMSNVVLAQISATKNDKGFCSKTNIASIDPTFRDVLRIKYQNN